MEEVELFLENRGWLDEISELSVNMYLMKIQYFIANELWAEADKAINEAKETMPVDLTNQSFVKFTIALLQKEESVQYNTGKFEQALETCTKAIELCKLIKLKHRLIDLLIDRNISNMKLGKLEEALDDIKMAMNIIGDIGNLPPSKIGVSLFQYAQVLREAASYTEAMKQYIECQKYWANNAKGEYRKMVTEMNMIYCISHGKLNPNDYFPNSINNKRNQIIGFFKKPENEIQLSPVNRKNLMDLSALKFT
jgi:tetratricopeptide (TPR) repeat protein